MTRWEEAHAAAHAAGARLARPETVTTADASGRTLAADVRSLVPLPGYSSSAMDGWAVRGAGPWRVGGQVVAGDRPGEAAVVDGSARPIMTGGPIPLGTDGILRLELGTVEDGSLSAVAAPAPGEHIRHAGEESAAGDLLIERGVVLTPPRIALAAVAGHDELVVYRAPRVAGVLLGAEVVAAGMPESGLVRDAYAPQFPALFAGLGLVPVGLERVSDDLGRTIAALDGAAADLIVTTGGTAKGTTDHIRAALHHLGAAVMVEQIAMRPGHPLLIARLPDGRLVLCLPGNPFAAMVALVTVGVPLVDGALGRPLPRLGHATLAVDVPAGRGGTRLIAARLAGDGATPTSRQGSGMLRGLAAADTILVVGDTGAVAGAMVPTVPLPW